ncbi:hypothetical protein JX266_000375 [Neoarthrinium moseri]|nr:hypothetical protein JX266_000375 [Neoarthrinium moseri]
MSASTPASEVSQSHKQDSQDFSNPQLPRHKRVLSVSSPESTENRRKAPKVSRACDHCKAKKARCSGTLPCTRCVQRSLQCVYDAKYTRGRARTPPAGRPQAIEVSYPTGSTNTPLAAASARPSQPAEPRSRLGSPDLDADEIEGQYYEPTSGLNFLHRAHRRLSTQISNVNPHIHSGSERTQPLETAGDKPLHGDIRVTGPVELPATAYDLLTSYFEVCLVTYIMFHRRTVMAWMDTVQRNMRQGLLPTHEISNSKLAVLFTIMAITTLKAKKMNKTPSDSWNEEDILLVTDRYYSMAASLTETEKGLPQLESAQARLIQVLYLLQTFRMNKAWYLLGNTYQIIVALGMHRRSSQNSSRTPSTRDDYIHSQCQRRTLWVAYTIDTYLSVVFGRPRYFRDEDINQDFPDSINDENMSPQGPQALDDGFERDSIMEGVIAHAKLSRIIGTTSRDVYSIFAASKQDRLAAANLARQELRKWRSGLPAHLSSINPSSLIPGLRRQAMALKLGYCHAVMHANRPFLLDSQSTDPSVKECVEDCLSSAKVALTTLVSMASDRTIVHAYWWSPYVAFCALTITYVWEIQQRSRGRESDDESRKLFALAEKCHANLAQTASADSPSRRYAVILEELWQEARPRRLSAISSTPATETSRSTCDTRSESQGVPLAMQSLSADHPVGFGQAIQPAYEVFQPFQDWQTTDWVDLDASVSNELYMQAK